MSKLDDDPAEMEGADAYERWSDEAHRIAARLVRDANNAPDIAQRALKKLVMLHPKPRNVAAWLTTTIRNLSIDAHRRDAVRPQLPDDDLARRPAARTVASGVVARAGIRDVLDGLPDQHRRALLLTAAGYSNAEIAEELGFASAASVAATVSRLRRQLRERRDVEPAETPHHGGDSQTDQAPQTSESVAAQQGVPMADIPVEIVERIRREPQPGLNVVAGSTPVVFFGEQPSASVATLGINPSSAEFVVRDESLTGERQRFETLDSLGISSMAEASDEHVQAVYERCLYYFRDPDTGQAPRPTTYWRWFQPLEDIIRPLQGASYLDGTACHLDLVQWATAPVWGKLTRQVQEALLYQDRDFLRWQLGAPQLELVYLNGDAVHRQFRSVLPEASVRECPMHSTDGQLKATFYGGWYGRTMVVGTSYYIQNGRARGPRANVQAWIVEVLRQIIARLEEEGPEGDLKALCDK